MRCKKNIILNLQNITSHFTGKAKIITLISIIIMLSFANIINTFALSYQSNVGVSFTFDPTLSVNISPSDLVISNLTPGATSDSNIINVSVASNTSYGYTLSAMMNGNNNDLTHANGTNTFSSIAIDSSLSGLTTDNTWGYSYKLSNDANWNNYSGLSTETSKTLVDSNDQTAIPIDFKIAAKAASTQASGTYTGVINFTAVTKHTPVTLAEAYASEGKTMINGFYTMQDMTSTICSKVEAIGAQLQVLDKRDNKLYWIAKLADNHCWMTQSLDLDLDSNRAYTHWDTDLGWTVLNENANWMPSSSTFLRSASLNWLFSNIAPASQDPGNLYWNGEFKAAGKLPDVTTTTGNAHYHIGNYYNWSAAVASNDTSGFSTASDSICPSSWQLPTSDLFQNLISKQNLASGENGNIQYAPTYFTYSGTNGSYVGDYGYYWTNRAIDDDMSYHLRFTMSGYLHPGSWGDRRYGYSIRCLAR